MKEAAQMKSIVNEYAAKVEDTLVEFRKMMVEALARYTPGLERGETSQREGRVPLASNELLAAFQLSRDACGVGDIDRMMCAVNFTPKQTSRPAASPVRSTPRKNLNAVLGGE